MLSFRDNPLLNFTQRLLRLRLLTLGLISVVLVPLLTLLYFGFQQLKNNQLAEYKREANNLVQLANRNLFKRRLLTNSLPVDAFSYYRQVYNPLTKQSQQVLSPMAQLDFQQPKISPQVRGLVGFFQYNSQKQFNSPIWPYEMSKNGAKTAAEAPLDEELIKRKEMAEQVYQLLLESPSIQQVLDKGFSEDEVLFKTVFDLPQHLIFYRVISVSGERHMQGYVVARQAYLSDLFIELMEHWQLGIPLLIEVTPQNTAHQVEYFFYQHNQATVTQSTQPTSEYQQQTLLQTNLRWPFDGYTITFTTHSLPMTPVMTYSALFMLVLVMAILAACYGFYRLGVKQLMLAEQRLNFVSSVSHELKTPLTSIRMYSEMLKEGTILNEQSRKDYYQFIYTESERLTRLINNILQLSKLSHHQQSVRPEYTKLTVLEDIIRSKTSSLIEKHQFQQHLIMDIDAPENVQVLVDQDAFSQVVINITDNAVKFFEPDKINDLSRQKVDFIFSRKSADKGQVQLEIRDYGQGISEEQENKIFELFYRGGNELTRTSQGTGIGLALVNELVHAQQGEIKVKRKSPGLAMILSFTAKG